MPVAFITHPACRLHQMGPGHPEQPGRLHVIEELLHKRQLYDFLRHHEAPRYVLASGQRIRPAPFINHSDLELMLIETLVGRVTPFPLFDEDYGGARRY